MIYVDEERCTGCGLCVESCPTGAIRLVDGVAQVEQSLCRECEVCLSTCPNGAILAIREPSEPEKPVPARVPAPQPARPGGVRPWLGPALAFVEREVVPRVSALLGTPSVQRDAERYPGRSGPVPYRPTGGSSRRNYGGRGRRRRARRRGRW